MLKEFLKNPWLAYFIGYFFSIFIGHLLIKLVVSEMHEALKLVDESIYDKNDQFYWHPAAIGFLERALYTASWNIGRPEFIAVWLTLKVAGQWRRWNEKRSIFNIFLIGSGLSILYATVGAKITEWLKHGNRHTLVIVPLILIVGSLLLWLWVLVKRKTGKKV